MIVFADTNVHLHFKNLDEKEWHDVFEPPYKVVVPIIVTRELDEKKNDSHARIRKRASAALKWIQSRSREREFTEIGVIVQAQEPRLVLQKHQDLDPTINDDRFIASVLQFWEENRAEAITVVTDDYGAQIKAEHFGLTAMRPSEALRLPDTKTDEEKEIQRLRARLERAPALRLVHKSSSVSIGPDIGSKRDYVDFHLESERKKFPADESDDASEVSRIAAGVFGHGWHERTFMQQYIRDYERYLEERYDVLLLCSKSLKLHIELLNDGTAPAGNVAVIIKLPPNVSWRNDRPRFPDRPKRPEKRDKLGLMDPMGLVDSSHFANILSNGALTDVGPPYRGPTYKKEAHEVRVDVDEVMHGIPECLPSIMLTMNDTVGERIEFEYKIHASNLSQPETRKIVVAVSWNRDMDGMLKELWDYS